MRKVLFVLLAALLFVSCESETVIKEGDIPAEITSYVKQHFPENSIIQVIKIKEDGTTTYDVLLEGGFKLEFDRKKVVESIESATRLALPESVLQEPVLNYIKTNYPDSFAVKWEKDDRRQEVELDNYVNLEFDLKGNFIKIDI